MMLRAALTLGDALATSAATWTGSPMSYLRTFGPAGYPVTRLGWGLGIISIVVCVVIAILLLGALFRRRRLSVDNDPAQLVVHRDAGGMPWIYIGVGITIIVLVFVVIWTLAVTAAVVHPPSKPALTVQVTASQWWWALRYDTETPSRTFLTANEIHIPVGLPVRFELSSADVIHSFWLPKLGGKMDVIPGQTNVTWLQADRPGVYRGQCAVFCGTEHARMGLYVVAQSPRDFRAWQEQQIEDALPPANTNAEHGQQVFQEHCAACHTIRGSDAGGLVGPDLTHLMARRTLAAGVLPNTPGNLAGWVVHPQTIKPGARMPDQMLSGPQLAALMAYLQTLR